MLTGNIVSLTVSKVLLTGFILTAKTTYGKLTGNVACMKNVVVVAVVAVAVAVVVAVVAGVAVAERRRY